MAEVKVPDKDGCLPSHDGEGQENIFEKDTSKKRNELDSKKQKLEQKEVEIDRRLTHLSQKEKELQKVDQSIKDKNEHLQKKHQE